MTDKEQLEALNELVANLQILVAQNTALLSEAMKTHAESSTEVLTTVIELHNTISSQQKTINMLAGVINDLTQRLEVLEQSNTLLYHGNKGGMH
jgi:uncharacterized coiled-coil protein SlyX